MQLKMVVFPVFVSPIIPQFKAMIYSFLNVTKQCRGVTIPPEIDGGKDKTIGRFKIFAGKLFIFK